MRLNRINFYCDFAVLGSFVFAVIRAAYQFYSGRTYITSDTDGKKRKSNTLNTTVDPEEKRKIIGDTFMKVEIKVLHFVHSSVLARKES